MLHMSSTVLFTGWLLLKRKRVAWRIAQGKFKILKGVICFDLAGVKERFIITNGIQHLLWATELSVIVMNMSVCWKCPFGHNFCLGGILNLDCRAVEVRAFKERNDRLERSWALPLLFDIKWFQNIPGGKYITSLLCTWDTKQFTSGAQLCTK